MRVVLFTHANRIKCVLKKFFRYVSGENLLLKDFANCTVLRIEFFSQQPSNANIHVIWEGGLQREQIVGGSNYATGGGNFLYVGTPLPEGTVIYMVRHGEGQHNVAKTMGTKWRNFSLTDAHLTETGITQAKLAGDALMLDAEENQIIAFVSDLRRTHETAMSALPHLDHYYVLPCLFELNGGCDGDMVNWMPTQENTTTRSSENPKIVWNYNLNEKRADDKCDTANIFELALKTASMLPTITRVGGKMSRRYMNRTNRRRNRRLKRQRGGLSFKEFIPSFLKPNVDTANVKPSMWQSFMGRFSRKPAPVSTATVSTNADKSAPLPITNDKSALPVNAKYVANSTQARGGRRRRTRRK
jgi:hypothetical protein